jgi:drug/metabolite transporter (DMT)-like permease
MLLAAYLLKTPWRRQEMTIGSLPVNYRLGSLYSLVAAVLLATQEPFSALAARRMDSAHFIFLAQFALLLSVPLMILPTASRRDFCALLSDVRNLGKLSVLFILGLCGLFSYNVGLSSTHPIITAAVLNLSPFWAVLVASVISKKAVPVSPLVFFGCFFLAFIGAMTVAWSQLKSSNTVGELLESVFHSKWGYAIPVPLFFALSGTLVGHWFAKFDEAATIAANFVVSAFILIPATLVFSIRHGDASISGQDFGAVLLLLLGTFAAAVVGRVIYQVALTSTDNDNGFVTMFFLLVPALSALITVPLSWWIPDLHIVVGRMFLIGLLLITAPLLLFLWKSWQGGEGVPTRQPTMPAQNCGGISTDRVTSGLLLWRPRFPNGRSLCVMLSYVGAASNAYLKKREAGSKPGTVMPT